MGSGLDPPSQDNFEHKLNRSQNCKRNVKKGVGKTPANMGCSGYFEGSTLTDNILKWSDSRWTGQPGIAESTMEWASGDLCTTTLDIPFAHTLDTSPVLNY